MQVSAGNYQDKKIALAELLQIKKEVEKKAWLLGYHPNKSIANSVTQQKGIDADIKPFLNEKRPIKKIKPIYVSSDGSVVKKVQKKYIKFAPIYYDFDNWSLSSDELIKLGEVVNVLNENSGLVVEIQVHTDSKNTEKHNQLLSDKRAISIARYMASRNVSPDQVYVKGYGEYLLVNKCKSFINVQKTSIKQIEGLNL